MLGNPLFYNREQLDRLEAPIGFAAHLARSIPPSSSSASTGFLMLGGKSPRLLVGLSLALVAAGGGLLLCRLPTFKGLSSGHFAGVLSG